MPKKGIPDSRALEKMTSDLTRLLERKNFSSKKDLNNYLSGIVSKGKVPKAPPKSALDFAQDMMYKAWDTDDAKERIELAHEALSISPDCADAYVLLAEEEAETLEEAKEFYQKGVEAGERALSEKAFEEDSGHFWGVIKTRGCSGRFARYSSGPSTYGSPLSGSGQQVLQLPVWYLRYQLVYMAWRSDVTGALLSPRYFSGGMSRFDL